MHLKHNGHRDIYFFDQNAPVPKPSPDLMRIGAMTFRPFVIVDEVGHNDTCFWSELRGPLYSIVKETAIKYNLSLYYYDYFRNSHRAHQATLTNYVDFHVFALYSTMFFCFEVWFKLNLGTPMPYSFDTISADHIVYKINWIPKPLFKFSRLMDSYSWLTLFLSLLVISVINHLFVSKNSVHTYIVFYVESFLHPVKLFQKYRDRFLTGIWLLLVVNIFANTFYKGQYFTTITTKDKPLLIDSWQDLAEHTNLPIKVGTVYNIIYNEISKNDPAVVKNVTDIYITKNSMFYEKLTPRLKIYSLDQNLNPGFLFQLLSNASEGKTAVFFTRDIAHLSVNKFHSATNKTSLYVSKYGGETQPIFYTFFLNNIQHLKILQKT